jgi:chloramphenicol 3-O phosphotransferase
MLIFQFLTSRPCPVTGSWTAAVQERRTVIGVNVEVIVLNGGSSAGKSSLAVSLQQRLDGSWLTLGVDDLIRALSHGPTDTTAGGSLGLGSDGSITVGALFRQAELAWYQGVAAMARAGAKVILDEVFLDGGSSQARLATALEGLVVVWIGVQCHPDVAEAREIRRTDRILGMARDQATRVHQGVRYDLIVDTTRSGPDECSEMVVDRLGHARPS